MKRCLLAALLTLWAQDTSADSFSGSRLMGLCEAKQESDALALCWAYLEGFYGGVTAAGAYTSTRAICPPPEAQVTPLQLGIVVVKYGRAHPDILHLSWPVLPMKALGELFPCLQPQ